MLDLNNKQSKFSLIIFEINFHIDRAKKKLAQAAKENREQLVSLQSKLEMVNNGKSNE